MSRRQRRVVMVTGGTRGIGRAVATLFHRRGDRVVVCARSVVAAALPSGILSYQVDVRQRAALLACVRAFMRQVGRFDVWVNAAGISRWRAIEDLDEPFVTEVVETSLLGTLWGCAAAAAAMRAPASIVNISSLAGKRGSANNSAYCAAKFAVNGITQALAKELGSRGIRVNAVCPGYVETRQILAALAESSSPAHGQPVKRYLRQFAATQTALGRLPSSEEVAEAVYFLASPAASAITGQCLNVDCGTLPQ